MKPVDSHAHLDFEQYDEDREEVIQRSKERLEFVVNGGSNVENNQKALELEKRYPEFVVANIGLHPCYPEDFSQLEEVKNQVKENNPAAIGEIGLDYHQVKEEDKREEQEKVFRELLELAEEMEKPVVIHSRDAEKDCVEILKEYELENIMLHCFNGTKELAEEAAKEGMKIGVTTQVLYSTRVQNIVKKLEPEDLLLETDAPFLYRGERNEPANVHESADKIAELKEVEKKQVVEATTGNATEFFR